MSEWREDNFLESLAHRSAKHMGAGLCPEAEILCARAEPDGMGPISAKLNQHVSRCPQCSDLRHRLALFDRPESFAAADTDAIEAERRVESWMKGFLASQSLHPQVPSVSAPKALSYPSTPSARPFWNMQWGLAAAAIIIIAVGVVYIRRSTIALAPSTEVARATPDQVPPSPTPSDSQSSPGPMSPVQAPFRTVAPKSSPRPKVRKPFSPAKTDTTSASHRQLAVAPEPAPQAEVETTPPIAPDKSVAAENSPAPTESTPVRPTSPAKPVALSDGKIVAVPANNARAVCATCRVASAAPSAPAGPPIHIPAGTRIWISIESTTPAAEGLSQFQGTLLLPVTDSNVVVLEKGTSVAGLVTTNGNQTTFQITEFVVHGASYKLTAESGTAAFQGGGSGRVVEFQSGKTAEMWLNSLSTFATSAAPGSRPGVRTRAAATKAGSMAKAAPPPKSSTPP
jgi:hypothetical protein